MGISANLFYSSNSENDTLHKRVAPSQEQLSYLQENWNNLASYLKQGVSLHYGLNSETWIQGSYKFGTLIRPVSMEFEYDVDLGLYLTPKTEDLEKLPSAYSYRNYVRNLLEVYTQSDSEADKVATPSKEKCERLHYKKNFHIDVPAYKLINDNHLLATLPDNWQDSNPKELYLWFRGECEKAKDPQQLKRIIQYVKNWAAQTFMSHGKEFQPSSIMLTVLVTNAYLKLNREISIDDDDSLTLIVSEIYSKFIFDSAIKNPTDSSENLNRMSEEGSRNFSTELASLKGTCLAAARTTNKFMASRMWERAFGHFFPIAAEEYASGQLPARINPEIDIDLLHSEYGSPVYTTHNSIMQVPKQCHLHFRITNPEQLPAGCKVEWVVRNAGKEAMNTNDMGHKIIGTGLFEHKEHTAYHGQHYMDCTVYDAHGSFYSFKRVPVAVLRQTQSQVHKRPNSGYRRHAN